MKSTLYFLQYNNYYDRVSKVEESLSEYMDYVIYTLEGVNFNPDDGVDTVVPAIPLNVESFPADYLLVVESGTIKSKWFVMDATRRLAGVWDFKLHRDTIGEYREQVMQMPCFVEKGIVNEQDNTIFNNEGMTYNQIKQSEQLIKDKSECQWIVGYYARKTGDATTNLKGTSIDYSTNITYTVNGINNWEYYKYATQDFIGLPSSIKYKTLIQGPNGNKTYYLSDLDNGTVGHYLGKPYTAVVNFTYTNDNVIDTVATNAKTNYNAIRAAAKAQAGFHDANEISTFLSQVGAIVYDSSTSKYYKVTGYTTSGATGLDYQAGASGTLHDLLQSCFVDAGFSKNVNPLFPYTVYGAQKYRLTIEEVKLQGTYSYDIPITRRFTYDAPYDVFAIPYSDTFKFNNITCSKTIAMSVAMGIATDYAGSGTLYDIQLLPYCPFGIDSANYTSTDTKEYSYIKTTGNSSSNVGVIFNVSSVSRQTFTVPLSIPVTDVKVDNETKFCRLVSPDFSSIYEFSPAKNRGVDYIKIDMTLKPFQPYIHLAPNFKGLNGADFDDARGLICAGNFSLPIVTDQWKTYQLQNINYEKMFNRQIQNMEVNNSIQREQERWAVAAGTLQGAAAGGVVGNTFGLTGAGIGGGIGGVASLVGGLRDLALNEQLRRETMAYTKDMHNLQMQNIQALPTSLSKVDAFNQQNKCFPFVEIYDCTDEEKLNLCNKIKYTGMTVNRVGKLIDYVNSWSYPSQAGGDDKWVLVSFPYIKGQLILSSGIDYVEDWNIHEDNHFINALAQEISKGVYYV